MMEELKFCKDCDHYRMVANGSDECKCPWIPKEINLVSGENRELYCFIERTPKGYCKPEAVYFTSIQKHF